MNKLEFNLHESACILIGNIVSFKFKRKRFLRNFHINSYLHPFLPYQDGKGPGSGARKLRWAQFWSKSHIFTICSLYKLMGRLQSKVDSSNFVNTFIHFDHFGSVLVPKHIPQRNSLEMDNYFHLYPWLFLKYSINNRYCNELFI